MLTNRRRGDKPNRNAHRILGLGFTMTKFTKYGINQQFQLKHETTNERKKKKHKIRMELDRGRGTNLDRRRGTKTVVNHAQESQRCWKAFTTIDYDEEGERVVQNENNTTEVLESLWRQSTKMKREKGSNSDEG